MNLHMNYVAIRGEKPPTLDYLEIDLSTKEFKELLVERMPRIDG